jgi:phosphate uptake regulator
MKRKVIQIAGSTQLISLPRKWAQRHDIQKGEEIEVTEEGNKLVVSTEKSAGPGGIEVDVTGLDRDSLMFFLRALYKNGYDEIKVKFSKLMCENIRKGEKQNVMDIITQEVSRLNGVEIFTQKENYCVIRSISEDTTKIFDTMVRRVFLLAAETIGDLIEGYEQGNMPLLETIQNKHDAITRFVNYSQRILNKVGSLDYKRNNILYHILEAIDNIIDLIKYSARELRRGGIKASKDGVMICNAIQKSFMLYYDLHYNFSLKKVYELNKNRYEVLTKIQSSQKKLEKKELGVLINMEQVLEHILSLTNARMSLEY